MVNRTDPALAFRAAFPPEVLEHVVMTIFDAYYTAFQLTDGRLSGDRRYRHGEFASLESHYLFPHERKITVDRMLRQTAERQGIRAIAEFNANKSSSHTVLLHRSFILTPHFVATPQQIVRPAEYRRSYFRNSAKQGLLPFASEETPHTKGTAHNVEEAMYAYLIHGPSESASLPGFSDIVFPVDDCRSYHEQRIRLFAEFAHVVNQKTTFIGPANRQVREEIIPDQDLPLRKNDAARSKRS